MEKTRYDELEDRLDDCLEGKDDISTFLVELRQLEANNDKDAIAVLADCHLLLNDDEDKQKGLELLNKAISLGSAEAAYRLGRIYFRNKYGIPQDEKKSFEAFKKGTELGDVRCCGFLSEFYYHSFGTEEDNDKAFHYAAIAAQTGNLRGIKTLALCYAHGFGTTQDIMAAIYWFKEFLKEEPDDDEALLDVAKLLANPFHTYDYKPSNEMLKEAFYYISKLTAIRYDDPSLDSFLKKSIAEANMIAGWFYEQGEVVPQDFKKAHDCLEIAAKGGIEVAKNRLKDYRKNIFGVYIAPRM